MSDTAWGSCSQGSPCSSPTHPSLPQQWGGAQGLYPATQAGLVHVAVKMRVQTLFTLGLCEALHNFNFVLFAVLSQWHFRLDETVSLAAFIHGFQGTTLCNPLNVFFPYTVARWHPLYVFALYSSFSFPWSGLCLSALLAGLAPTRQRANSSGRDGLLDWRKGSGARSHQSWQPFHRSDQFIQLGMRRL